MAKDPYIVLGVKRDASDAEIQKAFRRAAKKSHPDLFPGDKKAEDRFKELNAANDIIGDPAKRARFDRGEIDAGGAEVRQNPFARGTRGGPGGFSGGFPGGGPQGGFGQQAGGFAFEDLSDLFGGMFRGGGGHQGPPEDTRFKLEVDFADAATGATRRVTLPGGKSLDIAIPAGINDGQTIRLKGQGNQGADALVEVKIKPDPMYRREGRDIHIELPVSLGEAVLGGKVEVPTVHGPVTITVPHGANTGSKLRLKGKGVAASKKDPAGDQYVTLKVVLPKVPDPELEEFVKTWAAKKPYNPRG
ncbi:MAG: DnaJ domain-containing protein [Rhodospirillaceae bacterium]|nr:DnaJ domain-containing protein [Rhodospirillaceae bacterium]